MSSHALRRHAKQGGSHLPRPGSPLKPLRVALLIAFHAAAGAQPRERVDSTLPALETHRPGERVTTTRPLREASEARLREQLIRQAELDHLANPHFARPGAYGPVFPSVYLQPYGPLPPPCSGPGCGPPRPPRPQPR
jgi:hypothetical protein